MSPKPTLQKYHQLFKKPNEKLKTIKQKVQIQTPDNNDNSTTSNSQVTTIDTSVTDPIFGNYLTFDPAEHATPEPPDNVNNTSFSINDLVASIIDTNSNTTNDHPETIEPSTNSATDESEDADLVKLVTSLSEADIHEMAQHLS